MRFHEALARTLAEHDVRTIFGLLGDANLFAMNSFVEHGGRYTAMNHEASAVLAAIGYARVTGRLGAATVTHGPALTNTVTALAEAVKEQVPLLLIAGDTAVVDRDNLQGIAQREVVLATGAGFEPVRAPETLAEDVTTAIRRATLERRPIVLNVPVEFTWAEVALTPRPTGRDVPRQAVQPDPEAVEAAAGILAGASRPIVLAGRGAATDGARTALVRLADLLGAPLATTLRGKDLFRGEPHDLGVFGTLSHPVAAEAITRADCVIAFGAGLNRWTTDRGQLLAGKRVIHVDSHPAALGKWSAVDAPVVGDSAVTARQLIDLLTQAETPRSGFAGDKLAATLAAHHAPDQSTPDPDAELEIGHVIAAVEAAVPDERTVVLDGGRFVYSAYTALRVPHPSAYVHTLNFGSIGLGMGSAIGAAAGRPERPTLLVVGDGGFMLGGLTEFNTAVRTGADLIVVVLSDGGYGAEHVQFRDRDLDPSLSLVDWPDLGPVATSLGGAGFTVRTPGELAAALAHLPHRDRPVLIEAKLDPDRIPMGTH